MDQTQGATLPTGGKSKEEQLQEAGISTTTANRYEELAAPKEQLAPIVESVIEIYFATARHQEQGTGDAGTSWSPGR